MRYTTYASPRWTLFTCLIGPRLWLSKWRKNWLIIEKLGTDQWIWAKLMCINVVINNTEKGKRSYIDPNYYLIWNYKVTRASFCFWLCEDPLWDVMVIRYYQHHIDPLIACDEKRQEANNYVLSNIFFRYTNSMLWSYKNNCCGNDSNL